MSKTNIKNYLQLHLLVFIWGFTAILGALISIESIPLVWYRMLMASVFVFIYIIWRRQSMKISWSDLLKFLLGGVIIACHWIFFFSAIKVANVSIALVIMSTGALFTSLIEPFFFKRNLIILEIVLGIIIISGLYLIFNVESAYTLGIIYALIASFLSALFTVLNGLFIKTGNAVKIGFYQLLFGTVFVSIFIFFSTGFTSEEFTLSGLDPVYLIVLSSICTAFAFVKSIDIMKVLTPYTVMLTINLEPIYGILLAVFIFGESEKMSFQFYLGAAIIVVTVLINGLIKNKKFV